VRLDEGETVPRSADGSSGLAFMGGPMSVNDDVAWIPPVLDLIRDAVARGVPVIGHCLGGQLMAKALGGVVTRNAVKEIGWGDLRVTPGAAAARWLGSDLSTFTGFHWHGETFSLPGAASHLLSSAHCANQAFALGKHLAMQCHVEMTAELIEAWCRTGAQEIADSPGPAVQSPEAMRRDLDRRLARLHAVADRIYARWVEGLAG
jgi:GMP synthase-like glutamine amidotransferase